MKIQMPIVFAAAAMLAGACTLEQLGSSEQLSTSDPSDPPSNPSDETQQPTPPPSPYPNSPPQIPKQPYWIPLCEITWDTFQGNYVDTGTCLMVSTAAAPNTCTNNKLVNWQCNPGVLDNPHNQCSNDVPKVVGMNPCFMGNPPAPLPTPEIPGGEFPRPDADPSPVPTDPGV